MACPTDTTNVQIPKEGPMPGYTGYIPGSRNHVIGHSYSDASKRAAAISETLRHNVLGRSIHLGMENWPGNEEQDLYAELSQPSQQMNLGVKIHRCMVREAPPESRHASGKVDLKSLRSVSAPPQLRSCSSSSTLMGDDDINNNQQCIGTTNGPARTLFPMHMLLDDLPYKDTKLVLQREWQVPGPEYCEVNQGKHHIQGYTGHTHAEQHVFAKSYGQTTRQLRHFPAGPFPGRTTSGEFINYAENRPLVSNEFELNHPKWFPHNVLLEEGEGTLSPLPEGVATCKSPSNKDSSQSRNS